MPKATDTITTPACAFVRPPSGPPHWPGPAPQQPPELSRRRAFGLLAAGAAAGAVLVIAGPVDALAPPATPIDPSVCQTPFEVVMLSVFRHLDARQQDAALTYLQDIAAGWIDTGWTRLNARPEGGLSAMADDFVGLEKAAADWLEKSGWGGVVGSTPATLHTEKMIGEIRELQEVIATRAAGARAYTPAGVRAKARMLDAWFGDTFPDEGPGESGLLRSMIQDAAGVDGGAA